MTSDRVALIDWDEAHVDVPDLDLVMPHNPAGLEDEAHDIAAQASAAWEVPSAGTTSPQSSGSPKFEQSEQRRHSLFPPTAHSGVSRTPPRPRSPVARSGSVGTT